MIDQPSSWWPVMRLRIAMRAGRCYPFALAVALFVMALHALSPSYGFDNEETHPAITRKAVGASQLDVTLRMLLGLSDGTKASLAYGQQPTYSGQIGSFDEDRPLCRASNHFHNPTKPFPQAGVTDLMAIGLWCAGTSEFTRGNSSATWGTGFTAPDTPGSAALGNLYDWKATREAHLQALTLEGAAAREGPLARTFVTLGYLMHLVQDLAVPAHARDDFQSHIDPNVPSGNAFEYYVQTHGGLVDQAGTVSVPFDNAYVTRFWDTGQYRQTKQPSSGTERVRDYGTLPC